MVAAGVRKDEVVEEDLRVLRIDGMDSPAWRVYKDWACSLGEVDPLVQAVFAPSVDIQRSPSSPPVNLAFQIFTEANSIINHMAPLRIADFPPVGIPALPGPLPGPLLMVNTNHAKVAVTAFIEAIANPGANYPVTNALHTGVYICDVQYAWIGGSHITIPVHKREVFSYARGTQVLHFPHHNFFMSRMSCSMIQLHCLYESLLPTRRYARIFQPEHYWCADDNCTREWSDDDDRAKTAPGFRIIHSNPNAAFIFLEGLPGGIIRGEWWSFTSFVEQICQTADVFDVRSAWRSSCNQSTL